MATSIKRKPLIAAAAIALLAGTVSVSARVVASTNHQFKQVQLPTGSQGEFNVGIWIFNPANGRIRLCVLGNGNDQPAMTCSPGAGEGPAGRYYLQQIHSYRRPGMKRSGIWILNRQTGAARACVISDLDNPVGSLKCSKTQ